VTSTRSNSQAVAGRGERRGLPSSVLHPLPWPVVDYSPKLPQDDVADFKAHVRKRRREHISDLQVIITEKTLEQKSRDLDRKALEDEHEEKPEGKRSSEARAPNNSTNSTDLSPATRFFADSNNLLTLALQPNAEAKKEFLEGVQLQEILYRMYKSRHPPRQSG
jgi:hypothetical protein